jgi:hypothetical protein
LLSVGSGCFLLPAINIFPNPSSNALKKMGKGNKMTNGQKQRFSGEFEQALNQRAQSAVNAGGADIETLTKAELIAAGIERGTINGVAADTFLIAHGKHVPAGSTTFTAEEPTSGLFKSDLNGVRTPHAGGKEYGESRKTEDERKAILERQALKSIAHLRCNME